MPTIVSFNCNSVRKRLESGQFARLVEKHQPLVIGLQETKVQDHEFPHQDFATLGYPHCYVYGQKIHYGVALVSRVVLKNVTYGMPGDAPDEQRRLISADLHDGEAPIHLINGYFPQGENRDHPVKFPYKQKFYARLTDFLRNTCNPQQQLLAMGDMNISPQDIDIGIGEQNRKRWLQTGKCSFLPEEREMMARLLDFGLIDCYRKLNPDCADTFSWFDYRSKGFEDNPKRGLRIDLQLATQSLSERLTSTGIDYEIRGMPSPSDHAPIWAEFSD